MRTVLVTLVVLLTLALLGWMRADHQFDPRRLIPFLHGEATLYDAAGLAVIVIALIGLTRLHRGPATEDDPRYEYDLPDDEDD